jgi:hypothetical protein
VEIRRTILFVSYFENPIQDMKNYLSGCFHGRLRYKKPFQKENIKRGNLMVKINITIEGENISDIINELVHVSIDLLKANRKELREVLKILADESLEILNDKKTLERGAELYRKINSEINWTYKRDRE